MISEHGKGEITLEILKACNGKGISKTKIAYLSNTSFGFVELYVDWLIQKELLEIVNEDPVFYKTTETGADILEQLKRIEELIPEECSTAHR